MGPSPAAIPDSTTTTATSNPWEGASKYLTNTDSVYNPATGQYDNTGAGPTGGYEQVANYAQKYGQLSPEQNALISQQQGVLGARSGINQNVYDINNGIGSAAANGSYNTNFGATAPTTAAQSVAGQSVAGQSVAGQSVADQSVAGQSVAGQSIMRQNLADMGAIDPTNAIQNVLRGDPSNNPYLTQMAQANVNRAQQQFAGDITNVQQQVMPGINNDAFASGQYGSSRQGIAQGMALNGLSTQAQNLATNVNDANSQMFGSAFQNAQNNQSQVANSLAGLSAQNGQFNANLNTQNSQFNANLNTQNSQFNAGQNTQNSQFNAGNLQNTGQFNANLEQQSNAQLMAQNAQNFNNQSLGAGIQTNAMGNLFSTQDQTYAQLQQLAQMPQNQAHDALNAYMGAIMPGASLGGSTTQSTPYFAPSPLQQALGVGAAGAGLVANLSGSGK